MIKKTISSTNSCRFIINKPIDLNIAITYTLNWQPLIGTSAVDKSFIATMVSELASNIIKYATSGYIKLRSYEWPGTIEIEILAIDNGPGIGNIELAMQENFSSGGSLGLGLSGVQRIADKFEILSKVGQGTYVFARKNIKADAELQILSLTTTFYSSTEDRLSAFRTEGLMTTAHTINVEIGKCIRAYPGQIVSGDQVLALPLKEGYFLAIIDATGHGLAAHKMALTLLTALKTMASPNLSDIMGKLYELSRGQIGAALGLAFFDTKQQTVHYAGIGNTSLVVFNDKKWRGVSRDGVLGQRLPSFIEQFTTFIPGDMAIMFTDGLSESLAHNEAVRLRLQDANTIAYRLVDILGKTYDDASCIVLKWNK